MQNTLLGRSPGYPAAGKYKINIMYSNGDGLFSSSATRLEKLIISTLSPPQDFFEGNIQQQMVPFLCYKNKLMHVGYRFGGFGFFWSGILIICLFLWKGLKTDTKGKRWIVRVILIPLLISVLLNPYSWWARYVPQFWSFPILILVFSAAYGNKYLAKKWMLPVILSLFFINNIVSIDWNLWNPYNFSFKRIELCNKIAKEKGEVLIYFAQEIDELFVQHLSVKRIPYRIVNKSEFEDNRHQFDKLLCSHRIYVNAGN
jgi:hypothetical protein